MRDAHLYTHGHASVFPDHPRYFNHGERNDSRIQNATEEEEFPHT